MCSMPATRVIVEITHRYSTQRTYTTTVYHLIFTQEHGWRTKVVETPSMINLQNSLNIHKHIPQDATVIK